MARKPFLHLSYSRRKGTMRRVMLRGKNGEGKHALVDDDDYEKVSTISWYYLQARNTGYAINTGRGKKTLRMHNLIMGITSRQRMVDHINRNGLDNRKSNLRIVSNRENQLNAKMWVTNKSGYRCISWNKGCNRWQVMLVIDGRLKNCGIFSEISDAVARRNELAKEHYSGFII